MDAATSSSEIAGEVTGGLAGIGDEPAYRIDGVEHLEPFLTTVVSDSDLWMFISSTGALTAGRVDADHAIFPYLTDDRLHRSVGDVGPVSIVARTVDGAPSVRSARHRARVRSRRRRWVIGSSSPNTTTAGASPGGRRGHRRGRTAGSATSSS